MHKVCETLGTLASETGNYLPSMSCTASLALAGECPAEGDTTPSIAPQTLGSAPFFRGGLGVSWLLSSLQVASEGACTQPGVVVTCSCIAVPGKITQVLAFAVVPRSLLHQQTEKEPEAAQSLQQGILQLATKTSKELEVFWRP